MPVEIFDEKKFLDIAKGRASYCKIKKVDNFVKLKLRTPKALYTYKTDAGKAEALLKQLEIEKMEL